MSHLIQLEELSKVYQTGSISVRALNEINLTIDPHEMMAIIGPSGSGKSTMMNIIGLLDRPTSGSFILNGKDMADCSEDELAEIRNRTIGFVFQSFFLLPRLNAEQNIMLPLLYRGVGIKEAQAMANDLLKKLGIGYLNKNKPSQMSGGQQQRVAIARALIGNPDLILADEPTGALDSKTSQEIMDWFLELHNVDKRTVIIITHDANISGQCARVVAIKDGVIVSDETR